MLFRLSDPERRLKRRQDEKPAAYKAAIRQLADGVPVATICARFAFARSTVYRWRARLAIKADLHRELVEENRRLRRQVQRLAAEKAMLQSILWRGG
ncbi:helix-turn-helix domain-containing protein [Alsobacter sp. R-9]